MSLGHPQVLRLRPGNLAVELRVTEQSRALTVFANLRCLALRVQATVTHEAVPADDVERDDDPVSRDDVLYVGTDLLDDAHRLVAEDVSLFHEHPEHRVKVQVGASEPARRDPDDG